MNKILRKDINELTAYVPGEPIELVERKFGLKNVIKLASNENALGASPKVKLAVKNSLNNIFRYPDGSCYYLKNAMAKKLRLKTNNIIFGNGSDEIIDIIIKTFMNRGEEIITSKITFVEYEIIAKANGFKARTIEMKNFSYDLDAIAKNITEKTKIIFIANPNNPTGTYISKDMLAKFINLIPKNTLLVLDEAYLEFVDAKDFPPTQNLINSRNIIILRTFSKAYGLAGLRVGYAIARPEFIDAMERIRQPFNVNILAQKAAEAAIEDRRYIEKTREIILSEKGRIYCALEKLNIRYIPSQTNFIMFKTNLGGRKLCLALLKKGIIIRNLSPYKLNEFVRVTIGTPKENSIFIKNLKQLI